MAPPLLCTARQTTRGGCGRARASARKQATQASERKHGRPRVDAGIYSTRLAMERCKLRFQPAAAHYNAAAA
eukprot:4484766-Pleurochrysis_carterae.AAC.10